jgi:hypothetical protein
VGGFLLGSLICGKKGKKGLMSVFGGKTAALAPSKPAVLDTLFANVRRRSHSAEIRKIFWKPR